MQKIQFYYYDRNPVLRDKKKLKQFIENLFVIEKTALSFLSYVFCSDKHLLGVNVEFLQHDFYTDVITFNLSVNKEEIIGEVYLSVDRIKENAVQHSVSFNEELHRVVFHGALHLCGYKDKTKAEAIRMREMEDKYLKIYFKPNI